MSSPVSLPDCPFCGEPILAGVHPQRTGTLLSHRDCFISFSNREIATSGQQRLYEKLERWLRDVHIRTDTYTQLDFFAE